MTLTPRLFVDWDNDGSFADEADEGGYLMESHIRRGRRDYLLSTGDGFARVDPGEIILTLKNTDGRFTPDNDSGAHYPNVLPGRKVAYSIFNSLNYVTRDTFTGVNGTDIAAHTPDTDTEGGGWTETEGGCDIQSNKLSVASWAASGGAFGLDAATVVIDSGYADCTVSGDFVATYTDGSNKALVGLVLRYNSTDNSYYYLWYRADLEKVYLEWYNGSTYSTITFVAFDTDANETTISARFSGSQIDAYADGGLLFTAALSNNMTSTSHGIQFMRAGTPSTPTADNFSVSPGYEQFTGYISDIRPAFGQFNQATITAKDGFQKLNDEEYTGSLYTNQDVAANIAQVLTDVSWADGSNIDDIDADSLAYWYVFEKTSALDAIQDLAESYLGTVFVGTDGQLNYYSRHNARASQATITSGDVLTDELQQPQPWDNLRNKIEIVARPRNLVNDVEIWRTYDTPLVEAGDTVTLWANYVYNSESVPATGVIDPVSTTDYTANSQDDGGGTDLTANISITLTAFSTTAKLEIENTGATDAYITLLRLRGDPLEALEATRVQKENSASQTPYGVRSFRIDTGYLQDVPAATDFANYLKTTLASPKKFPRIKLFGKPSLQFRELFDRVTLSMATQSIDGLDFYVSYLEHDWQRGSPAGVHTTLYLEPVEITQFWVFPTLIGQTSIFGF